MTEPLPVLHILCGKIASGKSTLSASLSTADKTVLIAEDAWLNALYGDEMSSLTDYVRCAGKLRAVIGPHISALLNAGPSVVLDFQANTVDSRTWIRSVLDVTPAQHQLHLLQVPDAICLQRLRDRNARGDHSFAPTEEQFHQFSSYFEPPLPEEQFNIVVYDMAN